MTNQTNSFGPNFGLLEGHTGILMDVSAAELLELYPFCPHTQIFATQKESDGIYHPVPLSHERANELATQQVAEKTNQQAAGVFTGDPVIDSLLNVLLG